MASSKAPDEQQDKAHDDTLSFFSAENMSVAKVPAAGGSLNGFAIGFVGVYVQLYSISTDCSKYTAPEACRSAANAKCAWDEGKSSCGWEGFTCNWSISDEVKCLNDSRCQWNYKDIKCGNTIGYDSTKEGIFAGAMIVGAMLSSIYAGRFAVRFGNKVSFWVVGIVGIVSSVLCHVDAAADQFWVLCAGRFAMGLVLGLVCVACPMYVDQNAPPKFLKVDGVLFQVFTTLGILLAAVMGLAFGQSIDYAKDAHIVARMEGFCAFSTLLSLLMIVLAVTVGGKKKGLGGGEGNAGGAAAPNPDEYSFMQMLGPLTMGVVVAGTLQLTGINAVMNYAPTIMKSLGMEPLVGNFVVMLWNFVTTLVSIPLARILTMRQLFLCASLAASASCLLLCGIPVYPGVAHESVKNGVAITGIVLFIAAFEFGVGPCFFVLAQDLFPRSFRPKGASFTIMAQFVFNIIINVCYPIAVEGISGGLSGNQDKGQSVAFIFFGCIGFVCFILQLLFLHPWEDRNHAAAHPTDNRYLTASGHSPMEVATPNDNRAMA